METVVGRWSGSLGKYQFWKGIYYGTLRRRTLPRKENFPRQRPAPCFFATDSSLARTVPHFHQGAWPELPVIGLYDLHLDKIPSHLDRESICIERTRRCLSQRNCNGWVRSVRWKMTNYARELRCQPVKGEIKFLKKYVCAILTVTSSTQVEWTVRPTAIK